MCREVLVTENTNLPKFALYYLIIITDNPTTVITVMTRVIYVARRVGGLAIGVSAPCTL